MHIVQASLEDAEGILELQKLAYRSEAEIYDDFNIPPLRQTIEELRCELAAKIVLKAVEDGRIVGSVRAWAKEGTCYIERLIVHPDFQGRGIGTSLMREIENRFPDRRRAELFTGHKSERNLRLYARLGYRIFKQEPLTDNLTFVYLEKP
jgi:ribosomal protein S18 acetylase RimI-like enzyme